MFDSRKILKKRIFIYRYQGPFLITFENRLDLTLKASIMGAQWLSGRVLDSRPKGCGFEPHRRHCVVVLEQDIFILD